MHYTINAISRIKFKLNCLRDLSHFAVAAGIASY